MDSIDVEGACGTIHTNFAGRAAARLKPQKLNDSYMYMNEAPDECDIRATKQAK